MMISGAPGFISTSRASVDQTCRLRHQMRTLSQRRIAPFNSDALDPISGELERIGGSRAQHDLIEFTLLRAYIEANRLQEAKRLLDVRRPGASGVPVMGIAAAH